MTGAETVGDLWRRIKAREHELGTVITSKDLTKVHAVAFAIRDLVAALPDRSGQLSAAQRARLESSVKYVATLAQRLDATGDAKDQAATGVSFKQLESVLTAIEALYPSEALKPSADDAGPQGGSPQPAAAAAAPATGRVTITGEIVDAPCHLTKVPAGLEPAHRACARACIEKGHAPFVRDEESGRLYLAVFPDSTSEERERWLSQAGKRVRVTGRVYERNGLRLLTVEEVRGAHEHEAAPHGGVVGMAGDRHIEVVTTSASEIRVYLLDEFLQSLPVAGVRGTAVVTGKGATDEGAAHGEPGERRGATHDGSSASERRSALVADAEGEFLQVRDTRRQPGDEAITVTLELGETPLTMTLPFPEPGTADAPAHHH